MPPGGLGSVLLLPEGTTTSSQEQWRPAPSVRRQTVPSLSVTVSEGQGGLSKCYVRGPGIRTATRTAPECIPAGAERALMRITGTLMEFAYGL